MPPELIEIWKDWGLLGLCIAGAIVYRQPILGLLARATRDPVVEVLTKQHEVSVQQNSHFAENNLLFKALGPAHVTLIENTGETAEHAKETVRLLTDLLTVQRSIERELLRKGPGPI